MADLTTPFRTLYASSAADKGAVCQEGRWPPQASGSSGPYEIVACRAIRRRRFEREAKIIQSTLKSRTLSFPLYLHVVCGPRVPYSYRCIPTGLPNVRILN